MPFIKNKSPIHYHKEPENTRYSHNYNKKYTYNTKGGFGQYSISGRKKGCGCG